MIWAFHDIKPNAAHVWMLLFTEWESENWVEKQTTTTTESGGKTMFYEGRRYNKEQKNKGTGKGGTSYRTLN